MMLMFASYVDPVDRILTGWNFELAQRNQKMQARKIVLFLGTVANSLRS